MNYNPTELYFKDLPADEKRAIICAKNMQSYLGQESKEQTNYDFRSPEQVLSLLRFVSQGDFVKLARHPFAYCKTIASHIERAKINETQYSIGAVVSDFVATLIRERLNELRSVSNQRVRINAIADKEQNTLSDIESDALSTNKELRCWSLLAHHYIDGFSTKELSQYYRYSIRQIEYQLKFARDELTKIILKQENLYSTTTVQENVHVGMNRERVRLSLSEKDSMLGSMASAYSAPCSAFLWGDWSVLVSKRAIVVPVNKRVIVGLEPSAKDLDCSIYEHSDTGEEWILNEWHSAKITRVISESWPYLSSLPEIINSNHQPIRVCVFSDVPLGSGIHETTAISLCLAGCINDVFGLRNFQEHRVEQIAAILQSFWYPQISWAPIVCSSRSPNSPKVMIFDRTSDGSLDFISICRGDEEEIKRNWFLSEDAIKIDWVDFDLAKLVVLSHEVIATDLDEVHKLYGGNLSLVQSVGFGCLAELLVDYILDLNYEKVGMMMNLHHDILAACGLSSTSFNSLLRTLRCEPKVLGIKPSCCLSTHSAAIALVDGSPPEITQGLADLVQPLSPFLIPTPGLTRISSKA